MAGRGRGRGRGGRVVPVPAAPVAPAPAAPAPAAPAPAAPAPVAPAPAPVAPAPVAPAGRGRGRGGRGVVVPAPAVPAAPAGPAAPAAPAVQPAAVARGRGRGRGGRGGVQPAAEDPADQMAQLSIAGSAGDPSEAGTSEVGMGRGSVREPREGKVRITRPQPQSVKAGTEGMNITLSANYFEVLRKSTWNLYKHHVTISPEEDRTFVRKKLLRQHEDHFVGFLFDGSTLFSLRNACPPGQEINFQSTWQQGSAAEGTEATRLYNVSVRSTGVLAPTDYQYLQFFNVVLRECMEKLDLQLLRRDYYDPAAKITVPEYKLELWPGYTTSFLQCETNVLLQAEIKYRILRKDTVLEELHNLRHTGRSSTSMSEEIVKNIAGQVVMTKYNEKSYLIDEIDFVATPRSTFEQTKRGGKTQSISYCDYIQERYGMRVSTFDQPMLVSKSNARARRAGQADVVYLIPEFCVFTGLTTNMRNNFQLMRSVSNVTSVSPGARIDRLRNFNRRLRDVQAVKDKLNSWDLQLATDLVKFEGRQVPMESIVFNGKEADAGREASWDAHLRYNKPLHAINITKYVVLCQKRNEKETREFCKLLSTVAHNMQYTIGQPVITCMDRDTGQEYVYQLGEAMNKHNPQIVLCIASNNNAARYNAIKKRCVLERPIPSQVVLSKNIIEKKAMSVATKVAVQMNCKMGGAPWAVHLPIKGLMTIGFDVCHDPKDKSRSYGAMVSSTDINCVRWYSTVTHHPAGEELSINFPHNVLKCVQAYQKVNNAVPARIVIYRDGVGEGQVDHVLDIEVKGIKDALKPYYSTENPLKMAFVIVTKRINTRIFLGDRNPPPGTVVDQVITSPFKYDFFLVSQSVRQGTVTPTYYNVIEDTSLLKPDHIQRLTYKMTHMYFNWPGTVRVPAPCQYAHKLALLTSQSIMQMHDTPLNRTLYFL